MFFWFPHRPSWASTQNFGHDSPLVGCRDKNIAILDMTGWSSWSFWPHWPSFLLAQLQHHLRPSRSRDLIKPSLNLVGDLPLLYCELQSVDTIWDYFHLRPSVTELTSDVPRPLSFLKFLSPAILQVMSVTLVLVASRNRKTQCQ